jgi:hypothetical protein
MNPGWYPDPESETARRYWDGETWSAPLAPDSGVPVAGKKGLGPSGWLGIVAVVVLLIAAAVLVTLKLSDKDDASSPDASGDSLVGYNQRAIDVAKKLKTCTSTKELAATTVRCVNVEGDFVAITTTGDADEQDLLVAEIKDGNANSCTVVIKGIIIGANDEGSLTEVIGSPEQFAADHRGFLLCPAG